MTHHQLLIAMNTVWVVVAAVLVMFMQAGFAFLEAGLTRMKNAAHIAGKNVLILGVASLVYWLVGFGLAFGHGNGLVGLHGFAPSFDALLAVGKAPYAAFTSIPGAAGWLFEVVFAGVSLAIVWGAMAERAKLWVYFAFGVCFTLIYSVTSHWIGHAGIRDLLTVLVGNGAVVFTQLFANGVHLTTQEIFALLLIQLRTRFICNLILQLRVLQFGLHQVHQ